MNGYGHFAWPLTIFNTYWALFVAVMLVVSHLLWVRGIEGGMRQRLQVARQRFGKPVGVALVLFLIAFVSTGCYIYYNTNVLNEYRTSKQTEKLQADAEKKYKKYEHFPKPRITAVKADVDIFPERRAVKIRGQYTMVNKTGKPLTELHVANNPQTLTDDVVVRAIRREWVLGGRRGSLTVSQPHRGTGVGRRPSMRL